MADTFYIDLATFNAFLEGGDYFVSQGLQGCTPEVCIGAKMEAAIRAINARRIDGIVGPTEFSPALFAIK
jgi:hypothetical protein